MSRAVEVRVDLDYLRKSIAAGWVPMDPRTLLALIEALEADHAWHMVSSNANWARRSRAFLALDFGDGPR